MTELHPSFDVHRSPHAEVDNKVEPLVRNLERNLKALGDLVTTTQEELGVLTAEIACNDSPEAEDLLTYFGDLNAKLDAFSDAYDDLKDRLDTALALLAHAENPTIAEA